MVRVFMWNNERNSGVFRLNERAVAGRFQPGAGAVRASGDPSKGRPALGPPDRTGRPTSVEKAYAAGCILGHRS